MVGLSEMKKPAEAGLVAPYPGNEKAPPNCSGGALLGWLAP